MVAKFPSEGKVIAFFFQGDSGLKMSLNDYI